MKKGLCLLTGASGLLGREIMKVLEPEWDVLGIAFSRCSANLHKLDLTDEAAVEEFILKHKPNVIIHAAAERRPDIVAKDEEGSSKLNINSSLTLANICKKTNTLLLYISTDYVFDGTKAPYEPRDAPRPINDYGRQKLAGEKAVLENYDGAFVLRVPVLYGSVETLEECAISQILGQLLRNEPCTVSDYEIRYPTHVRDVAKVCKFLVSMYSSADRTTLPSIVHFSANEKLTKYGMMKVMAKVFKRPIGHIRGDSEAPTSGAARPYDCHLNTGALREMGYDEEPISFANGLESLSSFCS
eukprot:Nk52_evm28s265 gene=Nk52_evmTU28s265